MLNTITPHHMLDRIWFLLPSTVKPLRMDIEKEILFLAPANIYNLWQFDIALENHNLYCEDSLQMGNFNSYVTNYQRVSPQWSVSCKEHAEVEGQRSSVFFGLPCPPIQHIIFIYIYICVYIYMYVYMYIHI